jgi:hypothetical protein
MFLVVFLGVVLQEEVTVLLEEVVRGVEVVLEEVALLEVLRLLNLRPLDLT